MPLPQFAPGDEALAADLNAISDGAQEGIDAAAAAQAAADLGLARVPPAGGDTGQVLGKAAGDDWAMSWIDQTGGGGLPDGGLTGQVLGKLSDANLDVGWIDQTGVPVGEWQTFEPVIGGWTLGDGTAVGAYAKIGGMVYETVAITFGQGATFNGALNIQLAQSTVEPAALVFLDGTAGALPTSQLCRLAWRTQNNIACVAMVEQIRKGTTTDSVQLSNISGTFPITFAPGSVVTRRGFYRVANDSDIASAQPEPWITVTSWANDWEHYGGAYQLVQYRKNQDSVEIRGLARNEGTAARYGTIFTLPQGYWPPAREMFAGQASGVGSVGVDLSDHQSRITLFETGIVRLEATVDEGSSWVSLANIRFSLLP